MDIGGMIRSCAVRYLTKTLRKNQKLLNSRQGLPDMKVHDYIVLYRIIIIIIKIKSSFSHTIIWSAKVFDNVVCVAQCY